MRIWWREVKEYKNNHPPHIDLCMEHDNGQLYAGSIAMEGHLSPWGWGWYTIPEGERRQHGRGLLLTALRNTRKVFSIPGHEPWPPELEGAQFLYCWSPPNTVALMFCQCAQVPEPPTQSQTLAAQGWQEEKQL